MDDTSGCALRVPLLSAQKIYQLIREAAH